LRTFLVEEPFRTSFGERVPPTPGSTDVLIRVNRVGLCGSDLNTYRGLNPLVSYPRIPGHEIAGTIEAVGSDVPARLQIAQRVTINPYRNCGLCPACRRDRGNACRENKTLGVQTDGALTDQIVVPWQRVIATTLTDLSQLSLVEPVSVGFHAVRRGDVTASDTVAVFGCGVIGLGVVAAVSARRARAIAIDLDDKKIATAVALGAATGINAARENVLERLLHLTGQDGVDVAIEAVGTADTMLQCIDAVAPTGRVVVVGYASKPVPFETKLFLTKELDVRGSRNAQQQDFEAALRHIEAGGFPASRTVTKVFPFSQAGEALAEWSRSPQSVTKFLVDLDLS
jgi:threonine dehydrogenase-like Zn-dependent dehydrogenase